MLVVKIHKEPFGASCILSIRGKPSLACPLTSHLLTANQGIRPAPFVSSPVEAEVVLTRVGFCKQEHCSVGAGVVWSGVGAFMAARARGPCRPPYPSAQPSPTKGLSRGPQKLDKVLRQQTEPVSTVPTVPTTLTTPDPANSRISIHKQRLSQLSQLSQLPR